MKIKKLLLLILICLMQKSALSKTAPWVGSDLNGVACSGGEQGVGPFDYTNPHDKNPAIGMPLNLVERAHFTPKVESLVSGHSGYLEGDLDYTLRAWPNHHRALLSIIKYEIEVKKRLRTDKLHSRPECYLQRAIHFNPEDAVVYSLYGYFLHKIGRLDDAVKYYEKAVSLDPDNVKFSYSFGLLLIDLKRYDDAVKYAKIAYQNKNTPNGLKNKLIKLGVWVE